jgi:sulfofructosephosphate aldolase
MPVSAADTRLDALRTPEGAFTMVALDQRESLREMFPPGPGGELADDAMLVDFKAVATRTLSPLASGMLLDHPFGVPGRSRPEALDAGCGLLLAADRLHSTRGVGVVSTDLDPAIDDAYVVEARADALKYLVIWRRGDDAFRPQLDAFLQLAARTGLPTFVEGIVRPPLGEQWRSTRDRFDAILEAADDLSRAASVYKAEIPGYVAHDLSQVEAEARMMTDTIDVPWVVLSNGVNREDFADAVASACSGGADGFLAGRAIWADTVADPDPAASMADRSVARLEKLATLVADARESAVPKERVR